MRFRTKGVYASASQNTYSTDIPYVDHAEFVDLNGDGSTEAVVFGGSFPGRSEAIARPAYVFLDTGRTYTMSQLPGYTALQTRTYEFADFNGDGKLDMYVSTSGYDDSNALGEPDGLFLGTGTGFVNATNRIPYVVSFNHGSGVGDIDGDGDIDLVVNSQYNANAPVDPFALLNDGNGNFTMGSGIMPGASVAQPNITLTERYHWMSMADVNGDGRPDLIAGRPQPSLGRPNSANKVFLNTGNGFFDAPQITLPDHPDLGSNSLLTTSIGADLDGDGDIDLLNGGHTAEPYGGNWYVQVLSNDGSGNFTDVTHSAIEGTSFGSGVWIWGYDIRDINGDGLVDIAVTSYQGGSPSAETPIAWLGDGEGHFTPLLISDIIPSNMMYLAQECSLVWNGETMSLLAFTADGTSLTQWEIAATEIPQLDFGARSRGDIYRNLSTAENLDAGGGTDTFVISGARQGSTVSVSTNTVKVTTSGQTDTLTNFERIAFSDGTLAFDHNGYAGMAYRLYQAAFDRTPDKDGLGYWIRELDAGKGDLEWMANSFIASNEFVSTYGTAATVSNSDFITLLYANVLDRAPDGDGFDYWVGELGRGFERERVLASFSESAENQANVADAIAGGIWYV